MPGAFTRALVRSLDWIAHRTLAPEHIPEHQRTGRRGEEEAYFYLRKLGYIMVAQNFRSPRRRGEIDLIGWDRDTLCFIEVKTRTSHDVKPAEAAVDRNKQKDLAWVARDYLRHAPPSCQWRFDVVTVYYEKQACQPQIELFKNAFSVS
jgi:putative endonuclease